MKSSTGRALQREWDDIRHTTPRDWEQAIELSERCRVLASRAQAAGDSDVAYRAKLYLVARLVENSPIEFIENFLQCWSIHMSDTGRFPANPEAVSTPGRGDGMPRDERGQLMEDPLKRHWESLSRDSVANRTIPRSLLDELAARNVDAARYYGASETEIAGILFCYHHHMGDLELADQVWGDRPLPDAPESEEGFQKWLTLMDYQAMHALEVGRLDQAAGIVVAIETAPSVGPQTLLMIAESLSRLGQQVPVEVSAYRARRVLNESLGFNETEDAIALVARYLADIHEYEAALGLLVYVDARATATKSNHPSFVFSMAAAVLFDHLVDDGRGDEIIPRLAGGGVTAANFAEHYRRLVDNEKAQLDQRNGNDSQAKIPLHHDVPPLTEQARWILEPEHYGPVFVPDPLKPVNFTRVDDLTMEECIAAVRVLTGSHVDHPLLDGLIARLRGEPTGSFAWTVGTDMAARKAMIKGASHDEVAESMGINSHRPDEEFASLDELVMQSYDKEHPEVHIPAKEQLVSHFEQASPQARSFIETALLLDDTFPTGDSARIASRALPIVSAADPELGIQAAGLLLGNVVNEHILSNDDPVVAQVALFAIDLAMQHKDEDFHLALLAQLGEALTRIGHLLDGLQIAMMALDSHFRQESEGKLSDEDSWPLAVSLDIVAISALRQLGAAPMAVALTERVESLAHNRHDQDVIVTMRQLRLSVLVDCGHYGEALHAAEAARAILPPGHQRERFTIEVLAAMAATHYQDDFFEEKWPEHVKQLLSAAEWFWLQHPTPETMDVIGDYFTDIVSELGGSERWETALQLIAEGLNFTGARVSEAEAQFAPEIRSYRNVHIGMLVAQINCLMALGRHREAVLVMESAGQQARRNESDSLLDYVVGLGAQFAANFEEESPEVAAEYRQVAEEFSRS